MIDPLFDDNDFTLSLSNARFEELNTDYFPNSTLVWRSSSVTEGTQFLPTRSPIMQEMLLPVSLDITPLSMGCETIGGVATNPAEHNITVQRLSRRTL